AGAESNNRNIRDIDIAPFVNVVVSEDAARAREAARLPLAYYVGGMGNFYHASLSRLGHTAEADRIRHLWRSGRPKQAIAAVTDEMVDKIAICGPLEICRARLDEMHALGALLPIVPIPTEGTTSEKCRIIESLIA